MLMMVVVLCGMRMCMWMVWLVVVGCMRYDVYLCRADAATVCARDRQFRADVERGDGLLQERGIHAGIDERAEEHVAADAGEALEKRDAHAEKPTFQKPSCTSTRVRIRRHNRRGRQHCIHRAGAEALAIERHILEAQRFENGNKRIRHR